MSTWHEARESHNPGGVDFRLACGPTPQALARAFLKETVWAIVLEPSFVEFSVFQSYHSGSTTDCIPPPRKSSPPHRRPRQRPNPTHAPQNHSPKYVYPWEWHRKPQAGPHRCPGAQTPVEQPEPPSIREAVHSTLMHILLYINCRYISFDLTVFLFCLF